ncbi:hypothetical protein D187_000547 [Cystobacter fuscus DSM 2262]|uniref:Uncharacterized protein n=1 Tax=Cystobacter fuscus (strain ATCC 25194 / DSM 2262 / NBRC 100088 / M29) TaxID=1242864 RepID=S9PRJ7_CYSF2|nr:hypothetical protein D187_000547 [Cystobacter fuscus DSM 2262]
MPPGTLTVHPSSPGGGDPGPRQEPPCNAARFRRELLGKRRWATPARSGSDRSSSSRGRRPRTARGRW